MQQLDGTGEGDGARSPRRLGLWFGAVLGALVLLSMLLPAVPILVGVLLLVAFALHSASPDLRPYVEQVLRVPVARAGTRHARLSIFGGIGVILIVSGAVGATTRGHLRGAREQRETRELVQQGVIDLMERAEQHLAQGNVPAAELALLEADSIVGGDADDSDDLDELIERVRRSGDSDSILEILTRLPERELAALEAGTAVPEALDFGEPALTRRAVDLALGQLEEARRLRASR